MSHGNPQTGWDSPTHKPLHGVICNAECLCPLLSRTCLITCILWRSVRNSGLPLVLGARSWMVGATSGRLVGAVWLEPSGWNSDKWISHWALAGKGDTYWWRGVFPAATATTVAPQAKILGPVGNEHVENEHAGGLTALRRRELRRKEHADKQEKMFASATAARILRSTFSMRRSASALSSLSVRPKEHNTCLKRYS